MRIAVTNDTRVEGGAFWLYAECVQGVDPKQLEVALDREIEELATKNVSAAELKRAKETLDASEAYESETVTDLAENIGEYAVDAHWTLALEGSARRSRVKAKDVRAVVERFLSRKRRVVGWSVPVGQEESVGA